MGKAKADLHLITESSLNVTDSSFSQRLTKDKVVKIVIAVSSESETSNGSISKAKERKRTFTKRKPVKQVGRLINEEIIFNAFIGIMIGFEI